MLMISSTTGPGGAFMFPAAKVSSVFLNNVMPIITVRSPAFPQRPALAHRYLCLNSIVSISRFHTAAAKKQRYEYTKLSHEETIERDSVSDAAASFIAHFLIISSLGISPLRVN
jgi:hypothetical protein